MSTTALNNNGTFFNMTTYNDTIYNTEMYNGTTYNTTTTTTYNTNVTTTTPFSYLITDSCTLEESQAMNGCSQNGNCEVEIHNGAEVFRDPYCM